MKHVKLFEEFISEREESVINEYEKKINYLNNKLSSDDEHAQLLYEIIKIKSNLSIFLHHRAS